MHDLKRPRNRAHGAGWLNRLLALLQGVILVILVVVAAYLLVSFPVWWASAPRIPLLLDVAVDAPEEIVGLAPGDNQLQSLELKEITGELEVRFANPWTQWLYLFFGSIEILLVFLAVTLLRRIVGSIAVGAAFSAANARRLRWLGLLFFVEAIYAPGISTLLSDRVVDGLVVTGGSLVADWTSELGGHSFITGWIMLILSEVFRQGADLREDQSLTV